MVVADLFHTLCCCLVDCRSFSCLLVVCVSISVCVAAQVVELEASVSGLEASVGAMKLILSSEQQQKAKLEHEANTQTALISGILPLCAVLCCLAFAVRYMAANCLLHCTLTVRSFA